MHLFTLNGVQFAAGLKWRIHKKDNKLQFSEDVKSLSQEVDSNGYGVYLDVPVGEDQHFSPQIGLCKGAETVSNTYSFASIFAEKYPNNYIFYALPEVCNDSGEQIFWFGVVEDGFISPDSDILGTKNEVLLHYDNHLVKEQDYLESLNTFLYDSHKTLKLAINTPESLMLEDEGVEIISDKHVSSPSKKHLITDLTVNPYIKPAKIGLAAITLIAALSVVISIYSEEEMVQMVQSIDPAIQAQKIYKEREQAYLAEISTYSFSPGYNKPNENLKEIMNKFPIRYKGWDFKKAVCNPNECLLSFSSKYTSSGLSLQRLHSTRDEDFSIGPTGKELTLKYHFDTGVQNIPMTKEKLHKLPTLKRFLGSLYDHTGLFEQFHKDSSWVVSNPDSIVIVNKSPEQSDAGSFAFLPITISGKSLDKIDLIPEFISKPLGLHNTKSEILVSEKKEVEYKGYYKYAIK